MGWKFLQNCICISDRFFYLIVIVILIYPRLKAVYRGRGTRYPLMKWHISSWLFRKLDDFLQIFLLQGRQRHARFGLDFGFQYALIRNNRSKNFWVEFWTLPGSNLPWRPCTWWFSDLYSLGNKILCFLLIRWSS